MGIGLLPAGAVNYNFNKVSDYTEALYNIPNEWYLFEDLNLFEEDPRTQTNIVVPIYDEVQSIIRDKNWDARPDSLKRGTRRVLNFDTPHFPVSESIMPRDTAGIIDFIDWNKGDGVNLESIARLRDEKMKRLKSSLNRTKEIARAQLITTGTVYAPDGTLAQSYGNTINWYTEFGVAQTVIVTPLGSSAVDPRQYWEAATAGVQDGLLTGSYFDYLLAVCSPEYFQALITNDYYSDNEKQNAVIGNRRLERRLTAAGLPVDIRFRSIEIDGIVFVEYRGKKPDGTQIIPAGKAFLFPIGVEDMFKTFFAPAVGKFAYQNKTAEKLYVWESVKIDADNQEIRYDAESNFVNFLGRPQALIQLSLT